MRVLVCLFVCCPYYCIRSTYTFGGCTYLEMAIFFFFFVAMRPASTLDACAHRDGYGDIAYAPNPAKIINSQYLNFQN